MTTTLVHLIPSSSWRIFIHTGFSRVPLGSVMLASLYGRRAAEIHCALGAGVATRPYRPDSGVAGSVDLVAVHAVCRVAGRTVQSAIYEVRVGRGRPDVDTTLGFGYVRAHLDRSDGGHPMKLGRAGAHFDRAVPAPVQFDRSGFVERERASHD